MDKNRNYDKNGIKIGKFQNTLIQSLSGNKQQGYKSNIPRWKEEYPYLFSLLDIRVKEIKSKR